MKNRSHLIYIVALTISLAACADMPCDPKTDEASALTRANENSRQADIAMNKIYGTQLQAQATPVDRAAFMDAQADWLAKRDVACADAAPADDSNSTGWSIARAECLTRQTEARTAALQPPPPPDQPSPHCGGW